MFFSSLFYLLQLQLNFKNVKLRYTNKTKGLLEFLGFIFIQVWKAILETWSIFLIYVM